MRYTKLLIALVACTSILFAQEAAAPAPAKAAKGAKKEASATLTGKVVSVDAAANAIVVKVKKGEDTMSVEAGAKILMGKKEITLADLKTDATVTVTCKTVDGKKVAARIVEKAAAAAPKAGKAAKKTEAAPAAATAAEPASAPAAK